jgi:DNA replication protein DnaC
LTAPIDILGLTRSEFVPLALERGATPFRALAAYRAAFRRGISIEPWIAIRRPPIVSRQVEDGALKFCQGHAGGLPTESVLVPMAGRGRAPATGRTLCVSSQIGCARGCTFCETAQMGLVRNHTSAEIVGQWFAAAHEIGERPVNVVFMGMGEPMDNLGAVLQAVRVLCDPDGPAMAASKINISTAGRVDGIRRYGAFISRDGFRRAGLAVSLNAPNDAIRSSIMPIKIKTLDQFDFEFQPSLDRKVVRELAGLSFVERAHNVVLLGPPGTGKTHLAVALRVRAVEAGYSVMFLTLETLMTRLVRARHENRLDKILQQLTYPKVLILDEIGYLPLGREEASLFFRLLVRRYERASLIVTSNKSFLDWGEIFNDQVLATAILDRLLHHATTLNIKGESYRLKEKRKAGLLGQATPSPETTEEVTTS